MITLRELGSSHAPGWPITRSGEFTYHLRMRLFLALLAGVLLCSCGPSREDLNALIAKSAACAPGDTCVLAGQTDCTCGGPINSKNLSEVNDEAANVRCGGSEVSSRSLTNPHCQNGTCVVDSQ